MASWRVEESRDRARIEAFLRRDAASHLYALADLDDFFWPNTRWWLAERADRTEALCLLLGGGQLKLPILYAVCAEGDPATRCLLEAIAGELPATFFYNLGIGFDALLPGDWHLEPHGTWQKMALEEPDAALAVDVAAVEPLPASRLDELLDFYARDAYAPEEASDGRFFEPYMLETGLYRCVREAGRLVAVAGVHLCSARQGVAAVGNVATRPAHRGRGLARATTAAVCRAALADAPHVGLNVQVDNAPAIRCYEGLGFRPVRRYLEGVARRPS